MHPFVNRAVFLLVPVVLSLLSGKSSAQDSTGTRHIPYRGAQYYLGAEDELLMKVNIWGFVRKPGQYMVPTDTDLITLISFAGGPIEQAKIKSIKVIRTTTPPKPATNGHEGTNGYGNHAAPAHATEGKSSQAKVLTVNVKEYLKTGDSRLLPPLSPGDTIVVDGTAFNTITRALDFASKLAVLGQIYFWLAVAADR